MSPARVCILFLASTIAASLTAFAQDQQPQKPAPSPEAIAQLLEQLRAQDARLKALEAEVARLKQQPPKSENVSQPASEGAVAAPATPATPTEAPPPIVQAEPPPETHEHSMKLPGGGPTLKIRAFGDVNLGFGPDANALIFPLPAPVHNTTQIGEFDLFLSSRLSKHVSGIAEIVIGSDPTNFWGLDIERLQISYKPSPYFEISAGRYHTSIGYYNTAFHHGTWFQTATGRPFMFFFEDSGGILPVHSVGVTTTGLMPHTGGLELHWVAEFGNGRSSNPAGQPVQNFLADKNHRSFNLAAYIKPQWISGLQVGGSYYRDRLVPAGVPHVNQSISSFYVLYTANGWESLNEAVLMHNKVDGALKSFNSPLMYAQISKTFGSYRPYFRYQYINVPNNDPISIFTGRYQGPSVGLRMDFTEYAALKIQYNRLYQRVLVPRNGLDLQVAFTY